MTDNIHTELIPASFSGPDAPPFPPIAPSHVLDLALMDSVNLQTAAEREEARAAAATIIADAEARAAKLIAAAVADAEEQVADVRPLAEAEAEKIIQSGRDEASDLISQASDSAAVQQAEAEAAIAAAQQQADELMEDARQQAAEFVKTLEIDRELVKERQESLESREEAVVGLEQEAKQTLEQATAESNRLMDEASSTVDRLMRSGNVAAEAQMDGIRSDAADIERFRSDHVSEVRAITDEYETKLSNQNIENLELRQEIEQLRTDLTLALEVRALPEPSEETVMEPPRVDDEPTLLADLDDTGEDFVSPWLMPEEADDRQDAEEAGLVGADTVHPSRSPDSDDQSDHFELDEEGVRLGLSTGLRPNARLVEPLSASAFRATEDKKKRRQKRRR